MKICERCECPTEFNERITCPWCGLPYGSFAITRALLEAQRDKTDEELIQAMADDNDYAAAEEYRRRHLT